MTPDAHPTDCDLCHGPIAIRADEPQGRPRRSCGETCKSRAKRLRERELRAQEWERAGRPSLADAIRRRDTLTLNLWRAASLRR